MFSICDNDLIGFRMNDNERLFDNQTFLIMCQMSHAELMQDATVLLDDEKRSCVVHERNCHLRSSIDAFGAGFSCTSYSLLNKDAGKNATAMEKAMRNKEDPEVH